MSFLNWFLEPLKEHYADFEGRATRQQYWMFVLVYILIAIAVSIVEEILGTMVLGALLSLALLIPSLAIGARRLHDTGKSGWWQLVCLIPFIGWIIAIVLLAQKGDAGPNKYGSPASFTGEAEADPVPTPPADEMPTSQTVEGKE